ncbi:MAG: glycosyltransferase [Henriciella sp.]|nr:glycosyltransferase [Henriciella sp.]MBO6693962.1 glycosyltransferase [Henriciella sp.]
MHSPMVSIVMPSLNQADFIEEAIESVLNQDHAPIELIVSDGGSTDATIEILKSFSRIHDNIFWESQPDGGPAEAIARSLAKVRGEIVGWLNSDDLYAARALREAVSAFSRNPEWIMCYGRGSYINSTGHTTGRYPTKRPSVGIRGFDSGCFICQPTVFFKASLPSILGSPNTDLKTAFDYEYWIRAFKAFPERIGFIDSELARSRLHEDCITERMRETVALEGLAIGREHLGGAKLHWAATYVEELRSTSGHDVELFNTKLRSFIDAARSYLKYDQLEKLTTALIDSVSTPDS